jgi:hypothetical protein
MPNRSALAPSVAVWSQYCNIITLESERTVLDLLENLRVGPNVSARLVERSVTYTVSPHV